MNHQEILSLCDHTNLNPRAGLDDIKKLIDEGIKYGCASVCIPPTHVYGAAKYSGGRIPVCTVIGFPNGYMTSRVKAYETEDAIASGANEIDMVINLGMLQDRVYKDIARDIEVCRKASSGYVLKVIIECCLLSENEKKVLCRIVSESGADFIKTSTGFSTGGATREDVALMRENCFPELKIKAAGGIRSFVDAQDFINLGADRLGTSRLVKIMEEGIL